MEPSKTTGAPYRQATRARRIGNVPERDNRIIAGLTAKQVVSAALFVLGCEGLMLLLGAGRMNGWW